MANGTAEMCKAGGLHGVANRKARNIEIRAMVNGKIEKEPIEVVPVLEGVNEAIGAARCFANSRQIAVVWNWAGETKGVVQKPTKGRAEFEAFFGPGGAIGPRKEK